VEKRVLTGWNGSGYATLASERRYLYDGWNVVAELTPSDAKILWSYTCGIDAAGSLGAAGRGIGAAAFRIADRRGPPGIFLPTTATAMSASARPRSPDGAVAARYEYTPFGELLRFEGAAARGQPVPLQHQVHRRRYWAGVLRPSGCYSPSQERFINRDSIRGAAAGLRSLRLLRQAAPSTTGIISGWR
jgi:hypothetical protein